MDSISILNPDRQPITLKMVIYDWNIRGLLPEGNMIRAANAIKGKSIIIIGRTIIQIKNNGSQRLKFSLFLPLERIFNIIGIIRDLLIF